MKNSNALEKSRGVVIFAFNTDTVDYVSIAKKSARLVQHYLNIPVTLITDVAVESSVFDQVILVEHTHRNFKNTQQSQWRNGDRYNAYKLSPYDETILLDSDYLVLDRSLLTALATTEDYRLQHRNIMLGNKTSPTMGLLGLPYVWATVVLFKKTAKAKMLFDLVRRIQRNYAYYRALYNIRGPNFRNDYAFAIANNILNGYSIEQNQTIPGGMYSIPDDLNCIDVKDNKLILRIGDRAVIYPRQNIHVMHKPYLTSLAFDRLVDTLCQK